MNDQANVHIKAGDVKLAIASLQALKPAIRHVDAPNLASKRPEEALDAVITLLEERLAATLSGVGGIPLKEQR